MAKCCTGSNVHIDQTCATRIIEILNSTQVCTGLRYGTSYNSSSRHIVTLSVSGSPQKYFYLLTCLLNCNSKSGPAFHCFTRVYEDTWRYYVYSVGEINGISAEMYDRNGCQLTRHTVIWFDHLKIVKCRTVCDELTVVVAGEIDCKASSFGHWRVIIYCGEAEQAYLTWNGYAIIRLTFQHFVHRCYNVCNNLDVGLNSLSVSWMRMLKATVMRWELGLMSVFSTQDCQCRPQWINVSITVSYSGILGIQQSYGSWYDRIRL